MIYVVDSSTVLDENDRNIMDAIQDKKAIVLLNKSDLETQTEAADIRNYLDKPVISISAKEQQGMDVLKETIQEMFFSGNITFNDEIYITNIRHKNALAESEEIFGNGSSEYGGWDAGGFSYHRYDERL